MENFIIDLVEDTIIKAEKIYHRNFDRIKIKFNLKGGTAGQYRFLKGASDLKDSYFRFNIDIAKENGKKTYEDTVIHEVAHYITRSLANGKYVRPHGKEWKSVMNKLGVVPERCHSYTVPKSTRKLKYYDYKCDCMTHNISSIIHNRILKGQKRYCKKCKGILKMV